ncbi:MAG: T9SS type A sorting domain-containing protein [Saprospiraceae bacterium]
MKKSYVLAFAVPAVVAALAFFPLENREKTFHTAAERAFFKQHQSYFFPETDPPGTHIPIDSNILFPTGKVCGGCHGHDPNLRALITSSGEDVNMYDDWRTTMMANAARDPFWRAKVTHETLVNPAHSLELQDKCTTCHAPAGNYQAKLHDKKQFYTLADLYTDTLGLDGVNCQICHAQSPEASLGNLHSGALPFDTNYIRVAYGPYEFIFEPPMHEFVGITPKYGEHINDAGLCAGCHTLITETADLQGNKTGETFVEQATYHEWLNSRYDEQHDNVSCQGCHVPRLLDEIIISANYQFLTPKFPYGVHELAGANVTMLKILKENRDKLGISAKPEHFDSTIAATLRQLQQKTLTMSLLPAVLTGDTAIFDLKLENRAGHKFPSGYPARRAWVEFLVKNEAGETIFHSGRTNPDFSLPDEDANFEPHHDIIRQPGQVQIYEMTPGDVTSSFSNVLERGKSALKDNRLVPQGFRTDDPAYDTCQIIGHAFNDPDFNFAPDGTEGSGSDVVHFYIPTGGYKGHLRVEARVWYQSLPPKFVNPMFAHSSPEIDSFKLMFEAADRSPILVGEVVLDSVYVQPVSAKGVAAQAFVKIFPNPSRDGRVFAQASGGVQIRQLKIYDLGGKLISEKVGREAVLPDRRGVYIVVAETSRGRVVEKVVRE